MQQLEQEHCEHVQLTDIPLSMKQRFKLFETYQRGWTVRSNAGIWSQLENAVEEIKNRGPECWDWKQRLKEKGQMKSRNGNQREFNLIMIFRTLLETQNNWFKFYCTIYQIYYVKINDIYIYMFFDSFNQIQYVQKSNKFGNRTTTNMYDARGKQTNMLFIYLFK